MPTYEYRCAKCGEDLEVFQSFSEAPLTKHTGCGGKLAKVLSPAGIVLKGSGFYKTDNRGSKTATKSASTDSGRGDSGSSDSKKTSSSDSKAATGSSSKESTSSKESSSSKPETKSA